MRLYMPIIMIAAFLIYIAYLAFVKKELKKNIATTVYTGVFFVAVWGALYFILIK